MERKYTEALAFFKSREIPVLERGQPEYDRAVATANLVFRFSRPRFVVQPKTVAHVQAFIDEARSKKLEFAIKCNGHSYAGHSTIFKGISLDLRMMNKVVLDMPSKTVTMDAGCQWGHVYRTLVDSGTKGDRFIINGGRCPTVGVSGFILGGGLGPFTRSLGMGSDSLLEATLVTANGKLVTVKETDDPESKKGKLFWALRGAGGGNFGVLVNMKLKVHKLRGEKVVAGRYQWFPEKGFTPNVITTMVDFYTTKWPTSMTIDTTWICDLRQSGSLGGVRFTVTFDGSKADYIKHINKNIKNKELKVQLKRRVLDEPSSRFLYETLASQWLEETERAYPTNKTYELFSSFVFENDRGTIEIVTNIIRGLMAVFRFDFKEEQVNFLTTWIHSGGKAAEKKPTDSAFFWREAVFHTYFTVEWVDKWMEKDMRRFLTKAREALRPLSLNGEAAFMNFPDQDLKSYESAYFGGNREKLRSVKEMWDKNKVFNFAQGVSLPENEIVAVAGVAFSAPQSPPPPPPVRRSGPSGDAVRFGLLVDLEENKDEDEDEDDDYTDQLASEQWEQRE